jgi:hypothetical protein
MLVAAAGKFEPVSEYGREALNQLKDEIRRQPSAVFFLPVFACAGMDNGNRLHESVCVPRCDSPALMRGSKFCLQVVSPFSNSAELSRLAVKHLEEAIASDFPPEHNENVLIRRAALATEAHLATLLSAQVMLDCLVSYRSQTGLLVTSEPLISVRSPPGLRGGPTPHRRLARCGRTDVPPRPTRVRQELSACILRGAAARRPLCRPKC